MWFTQNRGLVKLAQVKGVPMKYVQKIKNENKINTFKIWTLIFIPVVL